MVQTLLRSCLWLLVAVPLFAQAPGGAPGAAPELPLDPALPDQLKELKQLVSDPKMAGDFQAIGLIQALSKDLDKKNPKDKERLAKGLGEVFRTGKVRPADKDMLYKESSDALAKLETDGSKELAKAVTDARFKDLIAVQAHLMLSIGKTEDDKQVELLLDTTVRSPHDQLRAASGEALGYYVSLESKLRHDVVKTIIREWGSLHTKATTADNPNPNAPIDPAPANARKTLREVEGKWNTTLQKLTGTSFTQFPDWQRWLNKNPNWTPPPAPKKT
jgi:hypothetical protein